MKTPIARAGLLQHALSMALLALPGPAAASCVVGSLALPPAVAITSAPPNCCYGQWAGTLSGTASNVDADSTAVVIYAQTDQYYIQPGAGAQGQTAIACTGGTWSNMTRGGARYCAVLAKKSWAAPATMSALPAIGGAVLATACAGDSTQTSGRTLQFGGQTWVVRTSSGARQGPGPNYFADDTANVRLDTSGKLHLRITHVGGRWNCAELYTQSFLGYGTYRFEVEGRVDSLDQDVVLGCFSYSDKYDTDGDEIDIEFSRWSSPTNPNSQFVVQPYDAPLHISRFQTIPAGAKTTHQFQWDPLESTCRHASLSIL